MKKIISIFLIILFVFALSSCESVDYDLSNIDTHNAITTLEMITSNYELNEGKTIKIRGILSNIESEDGDYRLVILKEESHDHIGYIEFILKNPPEEYPEGSTDITVTGKLSKYEANEITYYTLIDATMKIN